jgi:branched-subunit amino acid aminotransferase/4-amino-4-deoxychorismate lyase
VADAGQPRRVRLLVGRDGTARVELTPLEALPQPLRAGFAAEPVDPTDLFLFHKTTNRALYERRRLPAFDETLLWTPDGRITEAINANVVALVGGRRVTPPVACGLLPGTMREELLARGEIVEAPVTIDELRNGARWWLINSVRGWIDAVLTISEEHVSNR